ncbi:hypothetical protein ACJIZ3_014901 [Penstemon smallii]|uniref:Uncharacterized protein n=1 Tax=Penstemon smallii TaxID=265156 RepID=A0ABD3RL27_9LAMI
MLTSYNQQRTTATQKQRHKNLIGYFYIITLKNNS